MNVALSLTRGLFIMLKLKCCISAKAASFNKWIIWVTAEHLKTSFFALWS